MRLVLKLAWAMVFLFVWALVALWVGNNLIGLFVSAVICGPMAALWPAKAHRDKRHREPKSGRVILVTLCLLLVALMAVTGAYSYRFSHAFVWNHPRFVIGLRLHKAQITPITFIGPHGRIYCSTTPYGQNPPPPGWTLPHLPHGAWLLRQELIGQGGDRHVTGRIYAQPPPRSGGTSWDLFNLRGYVHRARFLNPPVFVWSGTASCWTLVVILLIYPVVFAIQRFALPYHRQRSGMCSTCGYDLTGNTSGRCPECGERT